MWVGKRERERQGKRGCSWMDKKDERMDGGDRLKEI